MQNVAASHRVNGKERATAGRNGQIDTTVDIVTPENIAFHYQLAGPFRRLGAYLLDLFFMAMSVVLLMILWFFVSLILGMVFGMVGAVRLFMSGEALFATVFLIYSFVLYWFYGGLFEVWMNGQTPGKRMVGIRVLTADGLPIHGWQAILRNILRLADCFPLVSPAIFAGTFVATGWEAFLEELTGQPVSIMSLSAVTILPTYGVGLLATLTNRKFQRVGDLVCRTIVVIEERSRPLVTTQFEDQRTGQLAALIPPNFEVSRGMASALATYVERRRYISPERRREIAARLAAPLIHQFGLLPDTSFDLLLCALYYRTFVADRTDEESPVAAAATQIASPQHSPPTHPPRRDPFHADFVSVETARGETEKQ